MIEDYLRFGQPWSHCFDLLTDSSSEIVRPTPLHRDPAGITGDRFSPRHSLVILGVAYNINGDAAGEGFRLYSRAGDNIEITHFQAGVPAANTAVANGFQCFIALHPSDIRNSPALDGYALFIQKIGTPIAGSCVTVWGVHTTMPFDNYNYYGTPPLTFPT